MVWDLLEINYTGPDQGEGNHRPDFVESVGCEPNFAVTDVTESDMIGLTSFQLFRFFDQHPAPAGTPWFRNDDVMWDLVSSDSLTEYYGTIANLVELLHQALSLSTKEKPKEYPWQKFILMIRLRG